MERADFVALRILLVSEKNHAALTLRAVLTLTGISRITSAEDSRRAIELLTMEPYDAVFSGAAPSAARASPARSSCANRARPANPSCFDRVKTKFPHVWID